MLSYFRTELEQCLGQLGCANCGLTHFSLFPESRWAWSRQLLGWHQSDHWKDGENWLPLQSDLNARAVRSTSAENPAQPRISLETAECSLNLKVNTMGKFQFLGTCSQEYADKNQYKAFPLNSFLKSKPFLLKQVCSGHSKCVTWVNFTYMVKNKKDSGKLKTMPSRLLR